MSRKILIVDDSQHLRQSYKTMIEGWGDYDVHTASNGYEALEVIGTLKPDLILLDIMMPGMHGYEVCKKIKHELGLKDVRIIVLSGKLYSSDISKIRNMGADDYIFKGGAFEKLKEAIEFQLNKNRNDFEILFYGTRGSISVPEEGYIKYGGNTSCIKVIVDGELIIFDAGTGIRKLGLDLEESAAKGSILISHTHWDHIQGFPFFMTAYNPKSIIYIYGPGGMDMTMKDIFKGQFEANYFPISLDEVYGKLNFIDLVEQEFMINRIKITTAYLMHPGITLAYRLEFRGKTLVYATDNEVLTDKNSGSIEQNTGFLNIIKDADILITDSQYTDEEYYQKKNWGHSSLSSVIEAASISGVKRLVLFHHDPMHSDEIMDSMENMARKIISEKNISFECTAAREKQRLLL